MKSLHFVKVDAVSNAFSCISPEELWFISIENENKDKHERSFVREDGKDYNENFKCNHSACQACGSRYTYDRGFCDDCSKKFVSRKAAFYKSKAAFIEAMTDQLKNRKEIGRNEQAM